MDNIVGLIALTEKEVQFATENIHMLRKKSLARRIYRKLLAIRKVKDQRKYTPETLVKSICTLSRVKYTDVISRTRTRTLSDVRALISWIAHEMFPELSLAEIGQLTRRDHSTVISHFKKVVYVVAVQRQYLKLKKHLKL